MLLELAKLRDEFESVGDVRGKGFMVAVELVADKVRLLWHSFCYRELEFSPKPDKLFGMMQLTSHWL